VVSDNADPPPVRNIEAELSRPRLVALLFCDGANQSKDGKNNILGGFDRIRVPAGHSLTPVFALFVRTAETIEHPVELTVFAPAGVPVAGVRYQSKEVARVGEHPEFPVHVQVLAGFQFPVQGAGVYWFDVSYAGVSLGGAALIVDIVAAEENDNGIDV
jgi:hypothetical protein